MRDLLIAVLLATAANGLAFQSAHAGQPSFWFILLGAYAMLAVYSLRHLHRNGTLKRRLMPRWGDLTVGALVALALLAGSWFARAQLTPAGSMEQTWLFRIYLQIGDADRLQQSVLLSGALLTLPVLEEIVWRGHVLELTEKRWGKRAGWPIAALLYAITVTPTIFLLADPIAGKNPLLVVAALGGGLVWSFMATMSGRVFPAMISHMAFSYLSAVQFGRPI